ncbi:ADP-ribosyl-(dinitrogen reductase) hydrolase [Achromobacter sp. F4_2707]|uniref:ADP-ribosyl-(dinitrogen reductase) hydrolase n=1 Tax=Achromobacter sp. F4_2707 TaxID=3114286 RepID=UPI0039C5ABE6
MKLRINGRIKAKLSEKNPPITEEDIAQCFANRTGKFLVDDREENLTNPLTRWFISETDYGLRLKICFVPYATGLDIKTAYTPNDEEIRIYKKYGENNDEA